MADICVIGAGPAGSVFAARMAQLGHTVCLIERASFPRRHLGESLSPGVLPLLDTIGARETIETAGFTRVRRVFVNWESGVHIREDSREEGLLVDRGRFDQLLLEHAASLGVRVLQPARVGERSNIGPGWNLDITSLSGPMQLHADFLADAGGRSYAAGPRRLTGPRTLALYAYWQGDDLPREPRIEAGEDAWFWGVPLPDGSFNTLVFLDAVHFRRTRSGSVETDFIRRLRHSELLSDCRNARRISPVCATDATPYLHEDCVTPASIRIGDAALALDPVSSSGVQKAIQSALAAAIVANTLLRKPGNSAAAMRFYLANLAEASSRHAAWAAEYYGKAAAHHHSNFWRDRAIGASSSRSIPSIPPASAQILATAPLAVSSKVQFPDHPCIEGDFVTTKAAVHHPSLAGPIAFLQGCELAPLLRSVHPGLTAMQLARSWSANIPLQTALAIAAWLVNNGLLVYTPFVTCAGPPNDPHRRVAEDTRS